MKTTISVLAIAVALATGSASAADLPTRKNAPDYAPPPAFSWTGFYLGANIGGAWRDNTGNGNNFLLPFGGFNSGAFNSSGVVGGGQSGFNYQFSRLFVVGYESDFQGTSIGSGGGGFLSTQQRIEYFGTVRGRVGITPLNPHFLVYGTGGFAYGRVSNDGFFSSSVTKTGWTAGGGVEWAFLPNWSAKVEYLYTNLNSGGGNSGFGFGFNNQSSVKFHTVRAGVNYHFNLFNLFAAAPVVARY